MGKTLSPQFIQLALDQIGSRSKQKDKAFQNKMGKDRP
jgi:hypothetical protein